MFRSSVLLTVDTGPHIIGGDHKKFESDSPLVTGVKTRRSEHEIPDYEPVGKIITREIQLPRDMAKRLGNFFLHCYVNTPPKDQEFDCHSFVSYMMGQADTTTHPAKTDAYVPAQLDPQATTVADMQPYKPYGLVAWENGKGDNQHSVLALPGGENLSVFGVRSNLFIADTPQMMQDYDTATAHHVITPAQYHE